MSRIINIFFYFMLFYFLNLQVAFAQSSENWKVYKDDQFNFQLSYPSDWVLSKGTGMRPGIVMSIHPPNKYFLSFSITDFHLPMSHREKLSDIRKQEMEEIPKAYLTNVLIGKVEGLEVRNIECQPSFEGDRAGCFAIFDYFSDPLLEKSLYPTLYMEGLNYKTYNNDRIDPYQLFSKQVDVVRKILKTLEYLEK